MRRRVLRKRKPVVIPLVTIGKIALCKLAAAGQPLVALPPAYAHDGLPRIPRRIRIIWPVQKDISPVPWGGLYRLPFTHHKSLLRLPTRHSLPQLQEGVARVVLHVELFRDQIGHELNELLRAFFDQAVKHG